jgi:hypothetical protein
MLLSNLIFSCYQIIDVPSVVVESKTAPLLFVRSRQDKVLAIWTAYVWLIVCLAKQSDIPEPEISRRTCF